MLESTDEAKSRLKHKEIVGVTAVVRRGFDVTNAKMWSKANSKERRSMIQSEVRAKEEEKRKAKAVGMAKQGAWTKWEGVTPRDIKWGEVLKTEQFRLQFMLKSLYDLLPTPVNLQDLEETRV